jgi:HlyD family secretion protein
MHLPENDQSRTSAPSATTKNQAGSGSAGSLPAYLLLILSDEDAGFSMMSLFARNRSTKLPLLAAAFLALAAPPSRAADEADVPKDAPRGAAVTVLKAAKSCFDNIVEVSGFVLPREETAVRPERPGLKVAEVLAEAGDTVTAGQNLARLNLPEGGYVTVQAPVAGLVSASTATIGAVASARGEALFNIIARNEYDLVGLVPVEDIAKLAASQQASIKLVGAGDIEGKVRRVAPTIEPNSQLGQVFVGVTSQRRLPVNSAGRA